MNTKLVIDHEVKELRIVDGEIQQTDKAIPILTEISLKLIINGDEFVSLLCLNQYPEELAIGFLYNECIIDSYEDIESIMYNERMFAVIIQLKEGIKLTTQDNVKSITSACGKGLTYINPLKSENFNEVISSYTYKISEIWDLMKKFNSKSELYTEVGGVHSVYFHHKELQILDEDIGRHNCVDKISGILLKKHNIDMIKEGIMISSGRISSEIMTKLIRLQVPIFVSRSAPTASAVKLAEKYNITLVGYVRGSKATVYTAKERILIQ